MDEHMSLFGVEVTVLISVAVTVSGLMITYSVHRRNMRKDADRSAAADAKLLAKVEQIEQTLLGMRMYGERLATVETKVDRAHIRIDRLEERMNKEG